MLVEVSEIEYALVLAYRKKVEALAKLILFAQATKAENLVC